MPVVTSPRETCPTTCTLMNNGCYAETGPLRLVWNRLAYQGLTFKELLKAIRRLGPRALWRYGQAGDLPPDEEQIEQLAHASRGQRPIIFSHHRFIDLFLRLNKSGFHINLSADTLAEADQLATTGLSVVVVLHPSYGRRPNEDLRAYRSRIGGMSFRTPGGNRVAICPATYLETNCVACAACSKPRAGGTMIGFPAHGSRSKRVASEMELNPWTLTRSSEVSPTYLRT